MIIMPGQSVSISVPMKRNPDGSFSGSWKEGDPTGTPPECAEVGHFTEVPPPAQAPIQTRAQELGLPAGLRVETDRSQWRCANCHMMQPGGSEQVWVPDGVCAGDPEWSVTEAARLGAYNGDSSAWCLRCARKFSGRSTITTGIATRIPLEVIGFLSFIAVLAIIAAAVSWLGP